MALIDKLRDEIIESQKAQASFARWKLLLVSAFGAAGLGALPGVRFSEGSLALLGLLPFVCLYVDTLCYHSGIRVITIARYLRVEADMSAVRTALQAGQHDYNSVDLLAVRDYETFVSGKRDRFNLEGIALLWVSRIASLAVALVGAVSWILPVQTLNPLKLPEHVAMTFRVINTCWLGSSAIVGLVLADLLYSRNRAKSDDLDQVAVQGRHYTVIARIANRFSAHP